MDGKKKKKKKKKKNNNNKGGGGGGGREGASCADSSDPNLSELFVQYRWIKKKKNTTGAIKPELKKKTKLP